MQKISIVIILLVVQINSLTYQITNEFSDQTFDQQAVQGWQVTGSYNNQKTTTCNGVSYFGGSDAFIQGATAQKSYFTTQSHTKLNIEFDLFINDIWASNQIYTLQIDGQNVFQKSYTTDSDFSEILPSCSGNEQNMKIRKIHVSISVDHQNVQFNLKMFSNLNKQTSIQSYGIRNLIISTYIDETKLVPKVCHPSCICANQTCVQCQDPLRTQYDETLKYCKCTSTLKEGSDWECQDQSVILYTQCDAQLLKQISNIFVSSNCGFSNDENTKQVFVEDLITLNWSSAFSIDEDCKQGLSWKIKYSTDGIDFSRQLNSDYVSEVNAEQKKIKIPLFDVFNIAKSNTIVGQDNNIYQELNLGIEMFDQKGDSIRIHKIIIKVYTRRDEVAVFSFDISKQVTQGCELGNDCALIVSLEQEGYICQDKECTSFLPKNKVPEYTVGQKMYVRIQFSDKSYKNYLKFTKSFFYDSQNFQEYTRLTQVIRQEQGYTDLSVQLISAHQNAVIQFYLLISTSKDPSLRNLNQEQEQSIDQSFQVEVKETNIAKMYNALNEQYNNFGLLNQIFILSLFLSLFV